MSDRNPSSHRVPSRRLLGRGALLAGVSTVALALGIAPVEGRNILQGGGAVAPVANVTAAQAAAMQQAQQAARQASNTLARATQAIQAMQAAQAAARNMALQGPSGIPNGLAPGGLVVAPGAGEVPGVWTGAQLPSQTQSGGRTEVEIRQTEEKAILNWESFNVGRETTVTFDQQGNASWVALNRVNDPSAKPSTIAGQIKADGQVFIINRNGVIFTGSSQVNTRALVASSAAITDEQFRTAGIYSTRNAGSYVPSFTDAGAAVKVEAGARIETHAPGTATSGGGHVLLLGSTVENAGTISTPKGQALLAAGDDFLVRPGYGTEDNLASTTRGSEVRALIDPESASGTVTNTGLLFAQQGDITLTGRTVAQAGVALATTSVNTRGTIHLSSSASDSQGTVTLGNGSVTAILPELDSTETALDSQRDRLIADSDAIAHRPVNAAPFDNLSPLPDRLDQSRVEIVSGGDIHFQDGSITQAQGGQVAASAGRRIFVADGASIDVSGVRDVLLPMSANSIKVNVQGNELRDAPVNRDSDYLKNADVWIDVRDLILVPAGTGGYATDRYYTGGGLLEVSGYLANTAHRIGEWAAVGGTITLHGPEVIAQQGAVFDISGGSLSYEEGYLRTTNFLGGDGKLYNVGNAPADMLFYGIGQGFIRQHDRWGTTEVWMNPFGKGRETIRREEGYTVGRDAGRLVLSAPTSIFEGTILADVVTGERQTTARPDGVRDGYKLTQNTAPLAGGLTIGRFGPAGFEGVHASQVVIGTPAPITPGLDSDAPLPGDRANTVWLDAAQVSGYGLGSLTVATGGTIDIDAPLTLAAGGALTLIAPVVGINADITAPGGKVTVTNIQSVPTSAPGETMDQVLTLEGMAGATLGHGVTIDVRGLWTNALLDPASRTGLAFIDGGDVSFVMTGSVTLESGSVIDVSSGGALLETGKVAGGRGGDVTLQVGHKIFGHIEDSKLSLDGELRAQGMAGGGKLTLLSPVTMLIGEDAKLSGGVLEAGEAAPAGLVLAQELVIPPGGIMPISVTETRTTTPLETPLPVSLSPVNSNPIVTAADWVLPPGVSLSTSDGGYFSAGSLLPAGSTILSFWSGLPAQTVVPAAVFPQGIPVHPFQFTQHAGAPTHEGYTYRPGHAVPKGTVLPAQVRFTPALKIDPDLFQSGFAGYSLSSLAGLAVGEGTRIDVRMPVLRTTPAAFGAPSGAVSPAVLESWLPPLHQEDPAAARLTQRGGANIALLGADLRLGRDATVTVDPGHAVRLAAPGQVTVEGTIVASGGEITIVNDGVFGDGAPVPSRGQSIWIGSEAVLDVAGQAVTARSADGRRYGIAGDGGAIRVGVEEGRSPTLALVVIQEGARLEASGAAASIDLVAGKIGGGTAPLAMAGDGGTIAIGSGGGLVLDGSMRAAAGGPGAAGGTLDLTLETTFLSNTFLGSERTPHVFTITQQRQGSVLDGAAAPGTDHPSLPYGRARISVEQIEDGGFDNLSIWSRDIFRFEGDVSLSLRQSLTFRRGVISVAHETPDARVSLAAPYVVLIGQADLQLPDGGRAFYSGITYPNNYWGAPPVNQARLRVAADLIDIRDEVRFGALGHYEIAPSTYRPIDVPGFAEVELVSRGDVRLGSGRVETGKKIQITAAQLYPTTGAQATIAAGLRFELGRLLLDPEAGIVIRGHGDSPPPVPGSVFGSLTLAGATIDQGGIVRAPLGRIILGEGIQEFGFSGYADEVAVSLRAGSITSVSAAGLVMPYGGTADGLKYLYNGSEVAFTDLANLLGENDAMEGIAIGAGRVAVERGALLDLSGGGELTGAGFLTGRGGSVDVLRTALIDANPAHRHSARGAKVYAIVPGYASAYAPLSPDKGAGDPLVGQQITLPGAVDGLPAGTYTLLPSTYALLPGAYRVEIGGTTFQQQVARLPDGSYVAAGHLGIANTAIRDSLATQATLTPAHVVRRYAQYNETSYSAFALANAATFNAVRPRLPVDGKLLILSFGNATGEPLSFEGQALFTPAAGGFGGTLALTADRPIEIKAPGAAAAEGLLSLDADDISAFDPSTLLIGGVYRYRLAFDYAAQQSLGYRVAFYGNRNPVTVREGATITAGQIFLIGSDVLVEGGAVLDTIGGGSNGIDSSLGYVFSDSLSDRTPSAGAVLAVANGYLQFVPASGIPGTNTIRIGDGAVLRTQGTITFSANGAVDPGQAELNARFLSLNLPELNIGDAASFAAAEAAGVLGSGWRLTQAMLDRLLAPSAAGTRPVEQLIFTVGSSINIYGGVEIDLRATGGGGATTALVLNTPAIYGWGEAGQVATLGTDTLVWNGITTGNGQIDNPYVSLQPGPVQPNGAGTGSGTLVLDAREIVFGYQPRAQTQNQVEVDRLALGFSAVQLNAGERITANNRGTLSVYRSGVDPSSFAGGDLLVNTPLLTGENGSFMSYRAGGAVRVAAPAVAAPVDPAAVAGLGAEVRLAGASVAVDTAVVLPSGRLVLEGRDGIELLDGARIDLSGRAIHFFDVTKYGWGGELVMESAAGDIRQARGSVIDISAQRNQAGIIRATATGSGARVSLQGGLRGAAEAGFAAGTIDIRAWALDDFAGLNERLNQGGVWGGRSFVTKTGDLTVGDEVRANRVTISADGGSLTVTGRIDASGPAVGTIRLAARDNLVLAPGAVLDAHGTALRLDSHGMPIDASNTAEIELTVTRGVLTIAEGAVIDLRAADGVARGRLELNVPRLSSGGLANDVAIAAGATLDIRGAASIAVNGFRDYAPADGIVDQALLDIIHADSRAFIDRTHANPALRQRLGGLLAHGEAFHLRPGVEIRSATPDGDLTIAGDLDFSGYRYGPGADPALRGSGEPGVVVIRAGGNLTVNGSINDGFAPPPATPDDNGWTNRPVGPDGRQGQIWAIAPMLEPGSLSWSMRLAAGADLGSADTRTLRAGGTLGESGDLVLSDEHVSAYFPDHPLFSVIRTGTGYLDLLAGRDYRQESLFGVYTAGTAIAVGSEYNLPFAPSPDGTVLGYPEYEAALGSTRMWFTTGGGDVLVSAQGKLSGFAVGNLDNLEASYDVGNWLWRQGGAELGQATAWGINFGAYTFSDVAFAVRLVGFTGIGALGGGNVTVEAGGDAGLIAPISRSGFDMFTDGLNLAVGGTGRVQADGSLVQTGGGDLTLRVGGRLNPTIVENNLFRGMIANIRGDIDVLAGAIGVKHMTQYGVPRPGTNDPRPPDGNTPYIVNMRSSLAVAPGDGEVRLNSRGDLALYIASDPGRVKTRGNALASDGTYEAAGNVWFTLWTDNTSISLFSAGGIVSPTSSYGTYYPPSLSVVAAGGSIAFTPSPLNLMPSPQGSLELLARDSIDGTAATTNTTPGYVALSGGSPDDLATPWRPGWALAIDSLGSALSTNYYLGLYGLREPGNDNAFYGSYYGEVMFVHGPFAVSDTNLHSGTTDPIRIYAVEGDVIDLRLGDIQADYQDGAYVNSYNAAKPTWVRAGRDIVSLGALILNNDPDDISIVSAGRDIINASIDVAGPGLLEVGAGRNIHQTTGTINSVGPIVTGDLREGAGITLVAGTAARPPAYGSFAALYLDPANLADPERPLADQPGKVAKTYDRELLAWLADRFGYDGDPAAALAFFMGLPAEQQAVFVRQVYYEELRQGGREHNDPDSRRFGSYLRGRQAIASLFPELDEAGEPVAYAGNITLIDQAGVHTDFGGGIQVLTPGGGVVLGTDGVTPPASTGLMTQGSGDIEIYSRDSVLLGLSRIMTTFGGHIVIWSAEGDINAGRGAKTTVLHTPSKRTYDNFGNVTLSPQVPSSGAGIATLNPIPEVAPGDIDLIAPLGTIDAGEAGIRVSGNVNLAALQVVNAANIQVQGTASGIPTAPAANVGAALAASGTAGSAASAATQGRAARAAPQEQPSIIIVEVIGYGGGDGSDPEEAPRWTRGSERQQSQYDPNSMFRVLGNGGLSPEQIGSLTEEERRRLAKL